MNGKITKFFALTMAVFFCFSFLSCSGVDYKEGRDREEDDSKKRDRDRFNPDDYRPDLSDQNCAEYQSSVSSFRPLTDLLSTWFTGSSQNNPFRKAEACLVKSIDQSLKPLCEEERLLKDELKEFKDDPEIVDEIEEEREGIEDAKFEYADILYEFADGADDFADTLVSEDTENRWKILKNLLVTREARGYADVIAIRARRLCGSTLRRQTRRQ